MRNTLSGIFKLIKLMKDKDVSMGKKLLFLVPVLYLIFPFDIIGDFFPLAGQLDDLAVIVVMWPILKNLLVDYNNNNKKFDKKDGKTIDMNRDDYDVD